MALVLIWFLIWSFDFWFLILGVVIAIGKIRPGE